MRWGQWAGNEAAVTPSHVPIVNIRNSPAIATELSPQPFTLQAIHNIRQKKPIYISSQKVNGYTPKPTNRIERSLILLHKCNSSNPHGEKCEKTTEKGAASKTIADPKRTSLLPDQRFTGDLPTLDDLKSPKATK